MTFSCRPTRQRDAFLVARFPLAVLIHHAAFAAGLLVTDEGWVVLGANVVLHHGSLRRGRSWRSEVSSPSRQVARKPEVGKFKQNTLQL